LASTTSPPDANEPAAAPRKKRGLFEFLFKSALGCTAFAIGSLIVLILLLPTLLTGVVKSTVQSKFGDQYKGSLAIGDLGLAWFGEQHAKDVVLRDPDKKDVAHASVVVPSLWTLVRSGGERIGRVTVAVDADLVQDDAGVTNLERALEPRKPAKTEPATTEPKSHTSPFEKLDGLVLDLQITSSHLTWSDAETRRLGTPFEVRDLKATVTAKGGAPIDAHADGRIVSDQPGKITLDAHVAGPIQPEKAWPLGKVDAHAQIEGFSTAMIDGIARLHGDLKEVIGNRFTLKIDGTGSSADAGDVDFVLDGERGSIALHGRLEGGAFRSRAPGASDPALLVTIPPPRGFLKTFVTPSLPPGTQLVLDASDEPWTVRSQSFVLPVASITAASSAKTPAKPGVAVNPAPLDMHAITTALAKSQLELTVAVPSHIAVENEATRKANVAASVSATRIDVHLVPGTPASVHMESALESGTPGTLSVDIASADPWTPLAQGQVPPVDAHVIAKNVSTVAIGAIAGEPERIPGAIGRALDVQLDAQNASLDSGTLRLAVTGRDQEPRLVVEGGARIADGVVHVDGDDALRVRWSPDAEWLQGQIAAMLAPGSLLVPQSGSDLVTIEVTHVALPLPAGGGDPMSKLRSSATADVSVHVSGATWSDETLRAAHTTVALNAIEMTTHLAAGGAISTTLRGDLQQGTSKGRLAADVSTANAWAFAGGAALPPVDARLTVEGVPTALVDAFAHQDGLVGRALGDKLNIALDARGASPTSGTVRAELTAPNASATLAGKLESGTFRATGQDGVHVTAKIPDAAVRDRLAAALPEGTALTWPKGAAEIALDVSDLTVPVPTAGHPFDLAGTLESTTAHVHASLDAIGIANAMTKTAKIDAGARDIQIDALLAPHSPLGVKASAQLEPGRDAKIALDARVDEPFGILRGNPLKPIDATVTLTSVDTATIDALAGKPGLAAGLLGPSLDATLQAHGASAAGGSLTMSAKSEALTLNGSARLDNGVLRCTGQEGLEVTLAARPGALDAYTKSVLPAGTKLQMAADSAPLTLRVHDVAIPVSSAGSAKPAADPKQAAPAEPSMFERIAKMSLTLQVTLPALVYSDASTTSGQKPVTVRNVGVEAHIAPKDLPYLRVSGAVDATPPGVIAVEVRALDPLANLAQPKSLDTWRAKVDVHATQLPTAIIDVLAGQGGLLVEALGGHVDATLQAPEISMSKGAFEADLKSEQASLHAAGHVADRTVIIDKPDGVLAHVGLGPVMSERIVGKLVPTLVDVQKPEGAAPAMFAVDALRFPLDGDLRKLDGNVRVDLGQITYGLGNLKTGLAGKIASALGVAAPTGEWKVPAITVPIQKGVAGYQKLPIQIGGHEYMFSGTYDMVTDSAQLSAQVPIKLLGKKVNAQLEKVSDYLDPETMIPITIKGSIKNPSVGLDNGALESALEKALEKAAGKGLGGLLDGLKKKKKD
jgi:hypothetical protein